MSPHSLDPSNRRAYRRRALPYLIPCYLMVLGGLGALANPDEARRTVVAELLPGRWELLWIIAFIIGGGLLALGLMIPSPSVELVGDWLCLYALGLNLAAALIVRGPFGAGLAPALYVLVSIVIGARILDLHQRARASGDRRKDAGLRQEREARLTEFEDRERECPT